MQAMTHADAGAASAQKGTAHVSQTGSPGAGTLPPAARAEFKAESYAVLVTLVIAALVFVSWPRRRRYARVTIDRRRRPRTRA